MINHANRFFKEMKRLEDIIQSLGWPDRTKDDEVSIWAKLSHECNPKDCILREDGLWETRPESYGRDTIRKFVFIFRYHPNYCCAGRPYYNHNEQAEFIEKSETEKVLYEVDGIEFVWGWNEIFGPTRIIWGMQPGKKHFFLRQKDSPISLPLTIPTTVKKEFREDVKRVIG